MKRKNLGSTRLLGVLTPQANTIVEPELWTLLPEGWSMINARLTSKKSTMEARLIEYTHKISEAVEQFANAPLDAIAFACTGSSYLIGSQKESRLIKNFETKKGIPIFTAGLATVEALRQLQARKIAIISPYPVSLESPCKAYWEEFGYNITKIIGPIPSKGSFHPIYTIDSGNVFKCYQELSAGDADLILMLGTGMPTLGPILAGKSEGLKPAISCNLALSWMTCSNKKLGKPTLLHDWISGSHWSNRHLERIIK